jgi:hypothetical protein
MTKASKPVSPTAPERNALRPTGLTEHEAAVALVSLLNGAEQVPTIGQLRSVVRRAYCARIISAEGGRHHG